MTNSFSRCMKKVLAAALILSFTAGLLPMQYAADNVSIGITAKAEDDESQSFSCSYVDGVLTIKAGAYTAPKIPDVDDDGNDISTSSIESVVTDGEVILKGDCRGLFGNLYSVKSIDISQVDTSEVTNMSSFFYCDYRLGEIKIGDKFKTGNVTDMSHMFYSCNSVRDFDFSGFDTSKVTDMSYMFLNFGVEELDLSGFDTSNVTDMSNMFERCSAKSINFTGWNTSKVECMSHMFQDCDKIESLDLTSFDTSNVNDMYYMFHGCAASVIDVSSFNTSAVVNMTSMFNGCSSVTTLDLSGFDTSNVTSFDSMFNYCASLVSVDVSSFNTAQATSFYSMFSGCSSLTSLDLSNFTKSDDADTGRMLYGCSRLDTIKLNENWSVAYDDGLPNKSFQYAGWAKAGDNTREIVSGDDQNAVLSEGGEYIHERTDIVYSFDLSTYTLTLESGTYSGAEISEIFDLCMEGSPHDYYEPNVRKIVLNDGVKLTGDCSSAFSHYDTFGGIELVMGKIDTSEVTDMSNMFQYCIVGDVLDLSSFDTSNVTNMSGMFNGCKNSSPYYDNDNEEPSHFSIVFGDKFDTSKVEDMSKMFSEAMVSELDLRKFDTSSVTTMAGMFYNCSAASIDVSSFDTSKVEDMSEMFCGTKTESIDVSMFRTGSANTINRMFSRSSIKSIDLSAFDMSALTTNPELFVYCKNLTSVKLPSDWQPKSLDYFFDGCSSLKSFDLTSIDCSNLTGIQYMFRGCTSLESADLSCLDGANIESYDNVFENSTALKSVILPEITKNDVYFYNTFAGCTSLETVNIENIKSQNIHSMSSMFRNCSSLKEIDLSNAASQYKYFYMESAFAGCTALETVRLPAISLAMNSSNSSSFRNTFEGSENITSITFNSGSIQNSTVGILDGMKLENANYTYTGWHSSSGDRILSGSGEYAAFSADPGTTYVRDKITYDKCTIKGSSLTLDGTIGLNYYLTLPEDIVSENSKAYVLMSGPSGSKKVMIGDAEFDKVNGYKFTYPVAAKNIHDKVSFKLFDGTSDTPVELYKQTSRLVEEVENNIYEYCVQDYITQVKNNTFLYDSKLVTLVKAIETYGNYAQKYFGYKISTIDENALTDVSAVTADTLSSYKFSCNYNNLPEDLKFTGYSLLLKSETALRFYFEASDPDRYEFEVGSDDISITKTSDTSFYVTIPDYSAANLSNMYFKSLCIYDTQDKDEYGQNKYICSMRCTPLSYAYSAVKQYGENADKEDLCNTMRALKLYSDAAKAYFG